MEQINSQDMLLNSKITVTQVPSHCNYSSKFINSISLYNLYPSSLIKIQNLVGIINRKHAPFSTV